VSLIQDIEDAAHDAAADQDIDVDVIWADIAYSVCSMGWDYGEHTKEDINDFWQANFGETFARRRTRGA
jgi:hypothetical protein